MAELEPVQYFDIGASLGIIGTMLIVLYFSRKQMQSLSVDIETKVLNDLDEKIHRMGEMAVQRPKLLKVLDKEQSPTIEPEELVFSYYVLYMCSYAFHMRQRKILGDDQWEGWMRWMKTAFERGKIREYWEKEIDPENWFDPSFQDFIDNEIIPGGKMKEGEI